MRSTSKSNSNPNPNQQLLERYSWYVNRFATSLVVETNHIFGYSKQDVLLEVHNTFDPWWTLHHMASEYNNPEYGWKWNTWEYTSRLEQSINDLELFYESHSSTLERILGDGTITQFLLTRLNEEEDWYEYEYDLDEYDDEDNSSIEEESGSE